MQHDLEPSPQLEMLRELHRSERAPAALERRLLARLLSAPAAAEPSLAPSPELARGPADPGVPQGELRGLSAPRLGQGAALAALGVLLVALALHRAMYVRAPGPEPTRTAADAARDNRPAPERAHAAAPGPSAPAGRPCPLDELSARLSLDVFTTLPPLFPPERAGQGYAWHALSLPTRHCGLLPRQYLALVAPGTPPVYRGPLLLLLPDRAQGVEGLAQQTRWFFDALARERQAPLVYASALEEPLPLSEHPRGGWQTDAGAHPELDDEAYLQSIVTDLARQGVVGAGNPLWLVGVGSGAVLALSAAAHHPERYAGVAALTPARLDLPPPASGPRSGRQLGRVLVMLDGNGRPDDAWAGSAAARFAAEWAQALGVPQARALQPDTLPYRAQRRVAGALQRAPSTTPGVRQLELGAQASGAPGVRVLVLDPRLDAFPPPGGADAMGLAASRALPDALNGADEVWAFLGG